LPDAVTLPQHFARHGGYRTESLGKVFHIGYGNQGDPQSFTAPHFHDKVIEYLDPASTDGDGSLHNFQPPLQFPSHDEADLDGRIGIFDPRSD
jgi:hypothetical protein